PLVFPIFLTFRYSYILFLLLLSSLSHLLSLFFFYYSRDPRDLHSFPTRRSSDLRPCHFCFRETGLRPSAAPAAPGRRPAPRPWRSEEHTSELQSRFDLVCRLLLEKKKKNISLMYSKDFHYT